MAKLVSFFGQDQADLKLADLHIHTKESDGLMTPQEAVEKAVAAGLSAIAITDHNTIESAREAQKYSRDKGYNLEVVIGSEITTKQGHLLGLYLQEKIPRGKSLEWTINEIHRQGGLAIAPHPFYALLRNLGRKNLLNIINNPSKDTYLDGCEIWNGVIYNYRITNANNTAKDFYCKYSTKLGAPIGGTDAHYRNLGQGLTGYEGDLHQAIRSKKTVVLYQPQRAKASLDERLRQFCFGLVGQKIRTNRFLCLGSV